MTEEQGMTPMEIERDVDPGLALGVSALIGSIWWVLTWFLYFKSKEDDGDLLPVMPLIWFWRHIASPKAGWMAASYFSFFWGYLLVSFVELIAWVLYAKYSMIGPAVFWYSKVGYWGSIILYIFPWLWAMCHLALPTELGGR